jgi:hypothetical protein
MKYSSQDDDCCARSSIAILHPYPLNFLRALCVLCGEILRLFHDDGTQRLLDVRQLRHGVLLVHLIQADARNMLAGDQTRTD